jgi:hypothetical protein
MVLKVNRDTGLGAESAPLGAGVGGDPAGERRRTVGPPYCDRAAQVQNLRERLAAGTYEVSAEALAESILNAAIHGRRLHALDHRRPTGSSPPNPR